ncbi:histidinol-phosphate aminotransferase [Paenibacillus lautus]|uniref:histidinol-phosphate transaminase n=1 Tax=Paenibacillus lautus TaxID=1401 RepID=UPI001B2E4A85|nr:histidinol-phosphate transaminase [Paenibacillus lautus]GIO97079.1 histidinol-phosphate aminotransferase [Paenibacillus lautus]
MNQAGEDKELQITPRQALGRLKPYTAGKPIWEVQQEYGLDRVIKLASNENSLGPSPKALQAIQEQLPDLHRYPDERSSGLTQALGEHLGLAANQFIVTNGGDELIMLISRAYLEPGDEIVVPDPTFSEYEFGAFLMSGTVIKVPLREQYAFCAEDILDVMTARTKIVYLCTPNNPTGTYIPDLEMKKLLDRLPTRVLVVIDTAYRHYATAPDYSDGIDFIKLGYPVITLNTFSKIYGLAGIRVGYGAASEGIIRTLLQVKEPFNVNALAQAAASAALGDEEHVQASCRMNEQGRQQIYEGLSRLAIPYYESMSNFILAELGEHADILYHKLLERGIIVRYAKGWGLPGHIRISVGTTEENQGLLDALGEILVHST